MSQKYRKLSLRLDNGALIGHSEKLLGDPSGGPVLLPVDRAFSRGLVSEQQAKRLEALLVQMHSRAPNAAPLRSLSDINRKRKEPDYAQDQAAHQKAAHLNSGRRGGKGERHSVGGSLGNSSWGGGDFYGKCREILTEVEKHLGPNLVIFAAPVDASLYPEYHKIVKQPMDLGTIRGQLDRQQYTNPQEFCDDMRQVWINCALFNHKDSPVGKAGSRADAKFEQLWAASGYDQGGRRRRVTGGIAAHKYEPSLEPEPKLPTRRSNSGQRNGRREGLQRMKSLNNKPMPMELMQQLAERLGQYAEDDNMEQILAIIRESQPVDIAQNNGEVELDFDALEPATLWRLYEFTENMARPTTISPADSEASDSDDSGDELE
ncbi:g7554 [Coccomyxa elongata]